MAADLIDALQIYIMGIGWLEGVGLLCGLAAVWLLIRRDIRTWPFGIAYALISLYVFAVQRLYASLALHLLLLALYIHGWRHWSRGRGAEGSDLAVTFSTVKALFVLLALGTLGTIVAGFLAARYTDAELPFWDNGIAMFSLVATWLTARKKIESWPFWLAIDLVAVGVYGYQGIYFYSLLYAIYAAMAGFGWRSWLRSTGETWRGTHDAMHARLDEVR